MKYNRILFSMLAGVMLVIYSNAYSQSGKVPPFQMVQANGRVFKAENLPMGKPIVIIYFSPDCDDCKLLMEGLLNRMNDFKKASIAMITYLSVENVIQFVTKYNLNVYSNIFVGTEGNSLFVRDYYKIVQFPFMALYNKNGDLIKIFNKENSLEDMSNLIRVL